MAGPRCALAILPAENGDPDRLLRSVADAKAHGFGDLSEVVPLPVTERSSPYESLKTAAESAEAKGFDRILAVSSAETVVPDLFVKTAPALRLHDAVWGAAELASTGKLERITRLAAQDLPSFFHAALAWWIGPSHFVRPAAARKALAASDKPMWHADYLLNLWRTSSAYKTAQALTRFHGPLPPLADSDRNRLIEDLAEHPVFMDVRFEGPPHRLPYTGLNPVIEREQMRGVFFEQEELAFLAGRLPRGLRILDVGANTGNHTLFFATAMAAANVLPFEPHPRAVAAIRAMVAANALTNVDLSRLGTAIGSGEGRLTMVESKTAGLGAAHFLPDPAGMIPVARLDDMVEGRVDFIKIDVEGMELDVLAGAERLIARDRPALFIEVVDAAVGGFMTWLNRHAYRVEKLFPDKTHCNYFAGPV